MFVVVRISSGAHQGLVCIMRFLLTSPQKKDFVNIKTGDQERDPTPEHWNRSTSGTYNQMGRYFEKGSKCGIPKSERSTLQFFSRAVGWLRRTNMRRDGHDEPHTYTHNASFMCMYTNMQGRKNTFTFVACKKPVQNSAMFCFCNVACRNK